MCIPAPRRRSRRRDGDGTHGHALGPMPAPVLIAHEIGRSSNSSTPHQRRHSSVERHAAAAGPGYGARPKQYPKHYNNNDGLFPGEATGPESRLKTMPMPRDHFYSHDQNRDGRERIGEDPMGRPIRGDPGYSRLVYDDTPKVHGVAYHPRNNPKGFKLATPVYR